MSRLTAPSGSAFGRTKVANPERLLRVQPREPTWHANSALEARRRRLLARRGLYAMMGSPGVEMGPSGYVACQTACRVAMTG